MQNQTKANAESSKPEQTQSQQEKRATRTPASRTSTLHREQETGEFAKQTRGRVVLCFALYPSSFLFVFKRTQREEEKEPQTKPHCNQLWAKKTTHPTKQPPAPQNPKPTHKTLANSLGSPCCQGSRPWPVATGGKLRWEACMPSLGYLGPPLRCRSRVWSGRFRRCRRAKGKKGKARKEKTPQTDLIVN